MDMKYKIVQLLMLVFVVFSCKNAPENYLETKDSTVKTDYFHTATQTLVSAHRGGSGIKDFPENALETLQHLHQTGITVFEID